jgi:uncharacterized Fe-S center protein
MKLKHLQGTILILSIFVLLLGAGCIGNGETGTSIQNQEPGPIVPVEPVEPSEPVDKATVYFTTDISPAGIMSVYNALEQKPDSAAIASGKVAVKVHTGESSRSNHLRPELIKDLVQSLNGTIVESNTAYGGQRASTALHKQVARDHGFTAIASVDILDEDGSVSLPYWAGCG